VKDRKCSNWLKSLSQFVEETETPRRFWLWGGIFTICGALQRKVWLPYGLDPLYPNMYIMLVAPPGKCRKGPPLGLSKKMLEAINVNVAVDSQSKRALTKELAEVAKQLFEHEGKNYPQAAISLVSKELSSLLAVDPKGMIEVLTDLYDSHDSWVYKTSGQGTDTIHNVCVCCFLGSTPGWISHNLPEEAMSGGWASRVAIIAETEKYKRVPIPPIPSPKLYEDLLHDLGIISSLTGEFQWGLGTRRYFKSWYDKLDQKYLEVKDDRLHSFLERIHVMVLKTAMALRVSYSNDLILGIDDVGRSIEILEEVLATASVGLSGQGRSRSSGDVERITAQIRTTRRVTLSELIQWNWRHLGKTEILEVLDTIKGMRIVDSYFDEAKGEMIYEWKTSEPASDEKPVRAGATTKTGSDEPEASDPIVEEDTQTSNVSSVRKADEG
jgi:hypothetical protein